MTGLKNQNTYIEEDHFPRDLYRIGGPGEDGLRKKKKDLLQEANGRALLVRRRAAQCGPELNRPI